MYTVFSDGCPIFTTERLEAAIGCAYFEDVSGHVTAIINDRGEYINFTKRSGKEDKT